MLYNTKERVEKIDVVILSKWYADLPLLSCQEDQLDGFSFYIDFLTCKSQKNFSFKIWERVI